MSSSFEENESCRNGDESSTTTQQQNRIEFSLQQDNDKLRQAIYQLQDENNRLKQENQGLKSAPKKEESSIQSEPPCSSTSDVAAAGEDSSTPSTEILIQQQERTINDLTQRVMVLIQEKLNLQSLVEMLEHKFVNAEVVYEKFRPPALEDNGDNDDDKKNQTKAWGMGKLLPSSSNKPEKQTIPSTASSTQRPSNLTANENVDVSRESWAQARGDITDEGGMLGGLGVGVVGGDAVSNQAKFLASAIKNKRESSTWGLISGIIGGGVGGAGPTSLLDDTNLYQLKKD